MSCSSCPSKATHSRAIGTDGNRVLLCATCYDPASHAGEDAVKYPFGAPTAVGERPPETELVLIGKPTFEVYTASLSVPPHPRMGLAAGIGAFTELGKRIGQRIVQVRMREDGRIPFEVIPLRDLMVKQHAAYYHAGTYFAEWFGSMHKEAKLFGRLMEDAIDAALGIKPALLRDLLVDENRILQVRRDLREMMPQSDNEKVSNADRVLANVKARTGGLLIATWRQRLTSLFPNVRPDQADVIVTAWADNVLESLLVGLIYLQRWTDNPRIIANMFLQDFVEAFTVFADAVFVLWQVGPV